MVLVRGLFSCFCFTRQNMIRLVDYRLVSSNEAKFMKSISASW